MAGYGQRLLLDWSAYTRYLVAREKGIGDGRLSAAGVKKFNKAVLAGELFVCEPFRLEAQYSAQSFNDFKQIRQSFDDLPQAASPPDLMRTALAIQSSLASHKAISHRVRLPDLLVAAVAYENDLGVLHYDKDYETIAKHAGTSLSQVWIAKKGSID